MKKLIISLAVLSAVYTVCALFHVGTGVYLDRLSSCGEVFVDSIYAQKYFDGECWQELQMLKTSKGDLSLTSLRDFGSVGQKIQSGRTYHLFDTGENFCGDNLYLLSSSLDVDDKYLRDTDDDTRVFVGIVLFVVFLFVACKWDKWF